MRLGISIEHSLRKIIRDRFSRMGKFGARAYLSSHIHFVAVENHLSGKRASYPKRFGVCSMLFAAKGAQAIYLNMYQWLSKC